MSMHRVASSLFSAFSFSAAEQLPLVDSKHVLTVQYDYLNECIASKYIISNFSLYIWTNIYKIIFYIKSTFFNVIF
ncbi:hypothetical protein XELAEV_18038436mg [Xenopus laevis]|uniref:Uncharacterized protein n=1 Tax=Xenopus laevis TaxID=8355 RepID=A0A974C5R8_XENLA|nr:hypothetical protein XELAEV_18038436mg [Xenopus laevis]